MNKRLALLIAVMGMGLALPFFLLSGSARAGQFGSAWSEQGTNALPVATSLLTSLSFNDQIWAIGGDNGGTATRKVYSSSDGITWAEVGTDALPVATRNHCSLVFDDKMWVIGGEDSATVPVSGVYSSSDGATWDFVGTIPAKGTIQFDGVTGPRCIEHGGLIWALGGGDDFPGSDDAMSSADGITWVESGDMGNLRQSGSALISRDGFLNYVGGHGIATASPSVYRSEDGVTWTQDSIVLPEGRTRHGGVTAGGSMYLYGGKVSTVPATGSGYNDVLSSEDGTTWVEVGKDALPVAIHSFGYTMFMGKAWIVGGVIDGTQVRTVYATDDIEGLLPSGISETISDIGADLTFADQSADTANNQLPFMSMVQEAEDSTGYPLVAYVLYLVYLLLAIGTMFMLGRLAPDNHWIAAIGVIVISLIGFVLGREVIDWYILVSITAFVTGVASISGKVSA